MRGKTASELDNLAAGLGNAEDPYFLKPLEDKTLPDLIDEVRKEIRYSALSMVRAGRYFMAIKKKVGHGNFEELFLKHHWSPTYVRFSMKLVEVVARFPQALHLPTGNTARDLLRLPMPKIEALLEDLPPEAVKRLSPWDLEKIHRDKTREEAASKPHKKKLSDEEARALLRKQEAERAEAGWREIDDAWGKCNAAMSQLAEVLKKAEIKPEWYDRIFDRELLETLGGHYDVIAHRMHPIEEVQKRAEVKHPKGFGH